MFRSGHELENGRHLPNYREEIHNLIEGACYIDSVAEKVALKTASPAARLNSPTMTIGLTLAKETGHH
jgi:hypothetical protein